MEKKTKVKVDPVQMAQGLTDDLNFIRAYFAAMLPLIDVKLFARYLKPDSKVTAELLKSWCSTASALPSVLLTTPGLIDVMANHIAGCWNNDIPDEVIDAVSSLKDSHAVSNSAHS